MHDLSFFLLKNWLPVGISAILFFAIGLLLAKFIWGRYTQRLANAIEENMNLASQWSALGASQQDLFKKLRVRWQADRDAYESVLAEKEARLSLIGNQLRAAGTEVPALGDLAVADIDAHKKVKELESALASEKAESAKLREELDKMAELPILPFAVNGHAEVPAPAVDETLQTRLRELEQDLIDTHDALHQVRGDYEKQVKLVETLEARLIAEPETVPTGAAAAGSVELFQLRALMAQRAREMRQRSVPSDGVSGKALEAVRAEAGASLDALRAELDAAKAEFATREAALLAEQSERETNASELRARLESQVEETAARLQEKESGLARLESDLAQRATALEEAGTRITGLESDLAESTVALEDARAQIAGLELIARRKVALQSELNDACHELYDVRRALHQRIETIASLEARLEALSETESRNAALELELEGTRGDLAGALQSLAEIDLARAEGVQALASLQSLHESGRAEAASLSAQLNETRREMSELRIALSAKTEDYQKALAQMEELEAIIGDRSAEVNDLSAELRQQRDLVRQLKNTLAETQGELEALSEESRVLNAGVKARIRFTEEQQSRIAALELALGERYRELNRIRVESEDHSRNVKHFESKSVQLESELQRRQAEFEASDRRVATVEEALEAAHAKIESLSTRLEQSEGSLEQLREELQVVSREKEETIRDLERASRRVSELEEAARKREIQIVELERGREEAGNLAASLERTIGLLRSELGGVKEELRRSQVMVSDQEAAAGHREARISDLERAREESGALAASLEETIGLLRAELEGVREEGRRYQSLVSELEESARQREERIAELELARKDVGEKAASFEQTVDRLQVELESAREEHRLSQVSVAELEDALRAGDERTLQLSLRLDEKEAEASRLASELDQLQSIVDAKAAAETEAMVRLASLESELQARVLEFDRGRETADERHARERSLRGDEVTSLRETIRTLEAAIAEETEARSANQAEIEALREKLASRVEEIKDLQNRIGEVMMQRASRDTEVALLKEKLQAMESAALLAADRVAQDRVELERIALIPDIVEAETTGEITVAPQAPVSDPSPYAMLEVVPEDEGIPLDELPGQKAHHTPQKLEMSEPKRPQPIAESVSWTAGDEEFTVFFNDSAHDLSRAEVEKVDHCARAIRRLGKKVKVILVGFAGAEGTPDFTESLSARRADAVRERLIERGVSVGVLKVRACGQDRRFTDWKARRVELILSPVAAAETVN
jgi:chromosome segregation ATPase/outer membrane protein OmpA-like peptidoglycan-associated protein